MSCETTITAADVWSVLSTIPDPEFGLSIVDLGLIYDVQVKGKDVAVIMTLTSPGCPAGAMIHEGVRNALAGMDRVGSVSVELVWEPAWSPERLTDVARQQLGWAG